MWHSMVYIMYIYENFSKGLRKLRKSGAKAHVSKVHGSPCNKYMKGNSQELAKDEAKQAKQRRKLRVLRSSSSSDGTDVPHPFPRERAAKALVCPGVPRKLKLWSGKLRESFCEGMLPVQ